VQEIPTGISYADTISILGFLSLADLGSPPVCTRHVVLPGRTVGTDQPDFRTLLHG
jgi:hypothetical protein